MKPRNPPPPTYYFGYESPPASGNAINGLGSEKRSRARHVFHNATGGPLPFDAVDEFFGYINPWSVVRYMLANAWQLRQSDDPPKGAPTPVEDPVEMADIIKSEARALGAELVGIAEVDEHALYQGREAPYKYAICIGLSMDRDEMVQAPQEPAAVEVMRTYSNVARIAVGLAKKIRRRGWPARVYGNPNGSDILQIPLAVAAGLGQLGKHGSMISEEYGSNFRLAAVLTDLPMAVDRPVDIGVEDLCLTCRRCVIDCPPGAIFNEKQLVRGEEKWYVDFDKCLPYFVKTLGCAICIEVCPWSEPGRGPELSQRLLARRPVGPTASPT
ncbi:MAG: 4Fe-4S dicluster domain-containing protein [Gemmatimonadetes bacterium]|nr:4Fe-4S dicluster domain-containing protein [Gemmatimonadota bacterium]